MLKRGHGDPDAAAAALVGLDNAAAQQHTNVANAPAREMLLRMPGMLPALCLAMLC